ncbi:hypothetical protein DFH11DRAFT_1742616 [Phellopilus nigrolimitatus]|nr:hypothetical protein DFH11DRAFT_1742616 [Phellopilus nigrolimitatus]
MSVTLKQFLRSPIEEHILERRDYTFTRKPRSCKAVLVGVEEDEPRLAARHDHPRKLYAAPFTLMPTPKTPKTSKPRTRKQRVQTRSGSKAVLPKRVDFDEAFSKMLDAGRRARSAARVARRADPVHGGQVPEGVPRLMHTAPEPKVIKTAKGASLDPTGRQGTTLSSASPSLVCEDEKPDDIRGDILAVVMLAFPYDPAGADARKTEPYAWIGRDERLGSVRDKEEITLLRQNHMPCVVL